MTNGHAGGPHGDTNLSGSRLYAGPPGSRPKCQDRSVYESYDQPLIPLNQFIRRVVIHGLAALSLLIIPLVIGVVGYMTLAGLNPVDAFLNASMILGGMGPVDILTSDAAKIFAGLYALFSGVFFLVVAGLIIAPFLHRVLHRLHVTPPDEQSSDSG